MKTKIFLLLSSVFFSFFIFELILRIFRLVPEVNSNYKRHDIGWTEKNVVLNSAGYRSKEYPMDRSEDTFRIYVIGDSYTYGWFVDNPDDVYPAIIEKGLSGKINKRVEVINAGAPGFSIEESIQRYLNEGKFYHPDLVLLGVNSLRVPVTGKFTPVWSLPLPSFVKKSAVYQITLGNILRKIAEDKNHKYLESVFENEKSQDWQQYSKMILNLRDEVEKIDAHLSLVLFPHVHPKDPNRGYDLYQYNKRFVNFGSKNRILVFDPLASFVKYLHKEDLVINPLDPHPTPQMNRLIAGAFLKDFDIQSYLLNKKVYKPVIETVVIDKNNKVIGKYSSIRKIYSPDRASYVYFEIKGKDTLSLPLADKSSRKTNYYEDVLETTEAFTTPNVIGGSVLFYVKPKQRGIVELPSKIYGYDVAGFENIYGIINEDTAVSAEYIEPMSIIKSKDKFIINYNKMNNYYIFRVSIPVKARQLDIDAKGIVKNMTETVFLSKVLEKESESITFSLDKRVSGFPQFFVNDKTYSYAFVDDKLVKVNDVSYDSQRRLATLNINQTLKKNQKIVFSALVNYELTDNEQIFVEVER